MKKKKVRVGLWTTLTALSLALLIALGVGTNIALSYKNTIDIQLGVSTGTVSGGDGETYYASEYEYTVEGETQLVSDGTDVYRQIVAEGTTLLKNENDALPVAPESAGKVSIFGNAAQNWLSTLASAMTDAGYEVDMDCWNFYAAGNMPTTSVSPNENPWSSVTATDWFSSVNGTVIVVLGRTGTEGTDNISDPDSDYLALSDEEMDMLNGVAKLRAEGTISRFIVLMMTDNNISFRDDYYTDYLDAVLWTAKMNETGVEELVKIISGETNPSGRLSDTIYKDNQANPVQANYGTINADLSLLSEGKEEEVQALSDEYKPSNDKGNHWRRCYVYQEGIYVGYRYYETRYEDVVMGTGNAGDFSYEDYVAFPFGAGLSYTTFAYSDFSVEENDDSFTVTVKVTNTGDVAGKTSVLAYLQQPYTDYDKENGVENSAVKLVGYTKTEILESGDSETVTITVDKTELPSYDSNNAKTYVLDAGDYYITVGGDSHEATNNILSAKGYTTADGMTAEGDSSLVYKWTNDALDTTTYSVSKYTGAEITNQLDSADPNKDEYASQVNSVVWLSRSDWEATFPTEAYHIVMTDEMADQAKPIDYVAGSGDASSVETHTFGSTETSLTLVDMYGKDYDDPDWESIVSQLTYEEMVTFINNSSSDAVASIGKIAESHNNGSTGASGTFPVSGLKGVTFTSTELRAATYNLELEQRVGEITGENFLHSSSSDNALTTLKGWSCNIHRSPYSGRNNEYYSEDAYLTAAAVSAETLGLTSKGAVVLTKHFVANDQEGYRHGVQTWANEQTLREIYIKPFAASVTDGNGNGFMNSFNRLGMEWAGQSYGAQIGIIENEFGFHGIWYTDAYEADYMDTIDGLLGGTNVWNRGNTNKGTYEVLMQEDYASDPIIQDAVFEAVHDVLYVKANSLMINGMSSDTVVTEVTSWWVIALYAADAALAALTVLCAVMLVIHIRRKKQLRKAKLESAKRGV